MLGIILGAGGTTVIAPTEVRTETVPGETVTVVEPPPPPRPDAEPCARGSGRAATGYEPNNLSSLASGELLSGAGRRAAIKTENDVDWFPVCIVGTTEVSLSLECLPPTDSSLCGDVYGELVPSQNAGGAYFDTDENANCTLDGPRRYYARIEAGAEPITYRVTATAEPAAALSESLPLRPPVEIDDDICL